jgi:excisionase family DNA binding protein
MVTRRTGPPSNGHLVPDRLLDVHEAATMLGLKPATLYQWAYERRIPVVKPSGPRGPLRFRLSTLQRLIAEWERPALNFRIERP